MPAGPVDTQNDVQNEIAEKNLKKTPKNQTNLR